MKTGFYSHPLFLEHDTGAHPENAERLRAIRNRLQSEGILDQLELRSGRQATSLDISMLHSEDLFEQVRQASEEGRQNLQSPDCVVSEQTFSAALQAVGSVLEAVEEVAERRLDNAFCAVRPPGHHAERDQAMGFCFFNNIALAAEYLTRSLGYKRVLIFDFDVHHGNGTQHLFEERDDIFLSAPIKIREVVILEQVIQMKPAGGPEAGLPGICLFLPGRKMLHTLTRLNTNCCRC